MAGVLDKKLTKWNVSNFAKPRSIMYHAQNIMKVKNRFGHSYFLQHCCIWSCSWSNILFVGSKYFSSIWNVSTLTEPGRIISMSKKLSKWKTHIAIATFYHNVVVGQHWHAPNMPSICSSVGSVGTAFWHVVWFVGLHWKLNHAKIGKNDHAV